MHGLLSNLGKEVDADLNPIHRVILTGHGFGGAIAQLVLLKRLAGCEGLDESELCGEGYVESHTFYGAKSMKKVWVSDYTH